MKKTKMYAKKSLSLFMAVMMLLTCWVWVVPEHEHASASGANNAAQVAAANESSLNSIPSFDTAVTTIHGKFESDSDYLDTQSYDAIYHNVLYTDGTTTIAASATSPKTEYGYEKGLWRSSNGVTVYWYHPTATLLYDGDKNDLPRLGVAVNTVMYYEGTWSRKTVNRLSWVYSGGNGFDFNENWRGSDGRLNFNWMWHGQSQMMGYTSTVTNTNLCQTLKGDSDNHFYANLLKFTGTMGDDEFWRSAQPTFAFYGDNGSTAKTITAKTGDTLYIINYVPLKKALQEALGEGDYANSDYTIANLKANASKYKTAAINEYVAAVKDLINAKPNKFVNSSKNDPSGYASAASAAVTRFNNAKKNLKLAKYTLTFQRIDGSTKTLDFDYGTEVNCETLGEQLAADTSSPFPNSVENIDNAEFHQDYKWDPDTFVTTVTDDHTITEIKSGTSNHSFGSASPKDDANHTRTCSVCKYVKTEAHTADGAGTVTKDPTCTAKGETTYKCKECSKKYTLADVAQLDHVAGDPVEENRKDATCTENGSYEIVTYCKMCGGDRQSEKVIINKTGHDVKDVEAVIENDVKPTCATQGSYDLVIYCKTCKKEASRETITIGALGHDYKAVVTAPTCTAEGYTTYTCSRCNDSYVGDKVSALGHDYKAVVTAPTCTAEGYTTYTCSRCNDSYVGDKVSATGHKPGTPVEENRVEANCKTDGKYDTVIYCTVCDAELNRTTTTLPSTGECSYSYTSNGDGKTHTGICTGCGEADPNNTTCSGGEANCVDRAICKDCNTAYGSVNPDNHKAVVTIPKKDSTCQVEGYEEYKRCNACSTDDNEVVIGEKVIIKVKDHKYTPWVSNGKGADGEYTHTRTCTTCVATNGAISTVTEKCYGGEATCTKQAVCEGCNTAYGELKAHVYDKEVVHSNFLKSAATCTAKAVYYKSCYCGESSQGKGENEATFEYGEILPHEFTEQIVDDYYLCSPATCTSVAKYYYACKCDSRDDEAYKAQLKTTYRYGELAPHNFTAEVQKEIYAKTSATCDNGGEYYKSCTACGAADKAHTFIGEKLPHVMATVVVRVDENDEDVYAATCNTAGQYKLITKCVRYDDPTGKCSCKIATELKASPATGKHDYTGVEWVVTEPTCGTDGYRVKTCKTCNTEDGRTAATITEVLPATGKHNFDGAEWNTVTDPTCNKKGLKKRKCNNCGNCEEQSVPVTGHSWLAPEAIVDETTGETTGYNFHNDRLKTAATCVAPAVYYKHCVVCGMTLEGDKALNGAEHTYTWGEVDLVNGHNFTGEIKTNDDGTYEYKCVNEGCNEYGAKSECTFDKIVEEVASTCQNYGYTKYQCTSCPTAHYRIVYSEELDPTNHAMDSTIFLNAKNAYCDEEGYTGDYYFECCYDETKTKEENDAVALDTSDEKKGQKIPVDQATGHRAENIITVDAKAPTCTEVGYESYQKCKHCGTVIDEYVEIPATGHAYSDWSVDNQLAEGGETVVKYQHSKVCVNCGDKVTNECSGGEATCIAGKKCEICNQEYTEKNAENHKSLITVPEMDSTCQKTGYEAYKYCADCSTEGNEVVVGGKTIIEKKDHVYGNAWTQTTVVNDEGVTEYKHSRTCLTCKAADGEVATESANCSGGVAYCNEKATCQVCKNKYGENDLSNHKNTSWHYSDNKKPATCTAPGNTGDKLYYCCNAVKEAGTVIPQLEHKFTVEQSRTDATCIETGSVTYKCKDCEEVHTEVLPINPRNHASNVGVTVGYRPATCTTAGFTGNVYHECCYDSSKTEDENRNALAIIGKEIPTDGTHSYTASIPLYSVVLDENGTPVLEDVKNEEGEVIGKQFKLVEGEITYAAKVAARDNKGYWYHVKKCNECDEIVIGKCSAYTHTINCVEHDICDVCSGLCSLINENTHKSELEYVSGTPATCVADGTKSYYKCKHCNKTYLDKAGKTYIDLSTDEGKAALKIDSSTAVHMVDWNNPVKVVTGNCGTSGYKTFKCTVEGCNYEARLDTGVVNTIHTWPVDDSGNYVYTVTDTPTCGSNGYQAIKCMVCQAIKLNSYVTIPATGNHTFGEGVEVPGTSCTEPGTVTYTCTGCGYKKIETSTTGVSAHEWTVEENDGWYVTGGNCLTGVSIERKCKNCDYVEQSTTSGEHDYIEIERVEPTAEKDGYVIKECKNCKFQADPEVLEYGYNSGSDPDEPDVPDVPDVPEDPEVSKHTFNYENYRVVEKATCTSAEIREYICLECGEKVRLPYGEMIDHVWLKQPAEKATCEKDGHSEYYRCVSCLKEEERENYPATGHNDGNGDGKCDKCSALLYEGEGGANSCSCMCHKTGFMGFIYKIARFFWKLFKTNPSCACGNKHY